MHPNVSRVVEAAGAHGLAINVRRFPEGTRTAADAARAIGCEVGQIVKSLVFVADDRPVLALVSGANRVDPGKLASAAGARAATGFAIGGIPPFGHPTPTTVLVDRALTAHEVVWAAAGLPDAVFEVRPADLVRASGGVIVDLADEAAV
jgi:prolyl-tRNA editing enzyme YbaK/EbsC (Cys-tRNA(Pro) deacylase)